MPIPESITVPAEFKLDKESLAFPSPIFPVMDPNFSIEAKLDRILTILEPLEPLETELRLKSIGLVYVQDMNDL